MLFLIFLKENIEVEGSDIEKGASCTCLNHAVLLSLFGLDGINGGADPRKSILHVVCKRRSHKIKRMPRWVGLCEWPSGVLYCKWFKMRTSRKG